MPSLRTLREWVVPGGLVVLGLLLWLTLAPEARGIAPLTRGYPWVVYGAGLLLAWRFRRSRVAAATLIIFLTDQGIPHLAPGHISLATDSAAYLLPLGLALLVLLDDATVFSTRGAIQVGGVVGLVVLVVATLLFRPEGAEGFLAAELLPRRFSRWAGLPPVGILAFLASGAIVVFSAVRRSGPVEKAFVWVLPASAAGLRFGPDTVPGSAWLMAAGLVLGLAVVEAGYAMAFHDELTGLPARRALRHTLEELGGTYTVAMVDVDHFKKFNDEHGHDVGDQVLAMVATRLQGVGGGGRAFRYGGEEFAVLFPGKTLKEARPFAEAMRKEVQKAAFVVRGQDRPDLEEKGEQKRGVGGGRKELSVTVSVGLAAPEGKKDDPRQVIEAADQALYEAKKKGRNRVEG